MTEEKIREAFRKFVKEHDDIYDDWESFKAGYLALLNSLERAGGCGGMELYYLPNGVTRD